MQLAALHVETPLLLGDGEIVLLLEVVGVATGGDDGTTELFDLGRAVARSLLERHQMLLSLSHHLVAKRRDRCLQLTDLGTVLGVRSLLRRRDSLVSDLELVAQCEDLTLHGLEVHLPDRRHVPPVPVTFHPPGDSMVEIVP